ncbi:aminotransferase class I/II-fold pyridoxal phosphate-dependent enzyme [Flavobacterium sp. MAH-1]|uniref:Aminotransferase class I/II-fold pyridoxal phosphate-dependent enzyme n=1 Tax=Flavobacterium agri TaxID=2743471 RepID=A0A7Y9C657_9FLAO|nr:GntG family PLP-dependent aldolase [Flavobacterium agri]NUY80013.1 aminotransferase class I/II-fold pyridoxal phosphate-dependent enzyme [Flavobacterium agri]NYA70038.1 aminotransferase class I/II-fold pyridoxal phosphate-dependent enzyme [Flavobacterium agri]
MEINLVSDTVTKPTPEMLEFMFKADVGDDVYKQDPTVNALQRMVANIFGMEDALFFPSGTMANQAAIKLHTQPGEQLIADKYAHVFNYEGGGVSFNSGVSCNLLDGDRGMINSQQVESAINPPDFYHSPLTSLVCVENTTNKGGGACYDIAELQKIRQVCDKHNLKFHLDGARIWNALVAKRENPRLYGETFHTISVCLSKGLGAPIGSLLISDKETINKALRVRKILGGGMRQVGYMAAAGIYALQHHVGRLAEDHRRAKELAYILSQKNWVHKVEPVETNILIFTISPRINEAVFLDKLKQKNISISSMGQGKLRIVTHLDYREVMHSYVVETLQKLEL